MTRRQRTRGALIVLGSCLLVCGCRHSRHAGDQPDARSSASAVPEAAPLPTATDSPPEPEPVREVELHHVGETAVLADYRISIVDVKECKPKEYFRPREGSVWLGVEVAIEATTDKEVRTSPFFARLVDGSGQGHTATFGGCMPDLKVSRLGKGDRIRGYVTFEVATSATGLRFEYDPFVIGGGKQSTAFTIVR